jgi:hypothetical protein
MDRHRHAKRFAAGFPVFFLPVFAIPLFLRPYAWAKAFGWKEEPETDVGLYFGRCLGALAVAGCAQGLRASRDPVAHRSFFGFAEIASWLLAAVHVRGLLEGRQPPIEHAEIALYSGAAIAARVVRPD